MVSLTSSVWTELGVAFLGGVAASAVILAGQWVRQAWIDSFSEWPFRVELRGTRADPDTMPTQIRVRILNRTSLEVHVNLEPLDNSGQPINGWRLREPWGYTEAPIMTPVGAHSWKEIWIEGPTMQGASRPEKVKLFASFFTFIPGRTKTYPIEFVRALGE